MIKRQTINKDTSIFILPINESDIETDIISRYVRKTSKHIIVLNRDTKEILMEDYKDIIQQIHFNELKEKVLIVINKNTMKPIQKEVSEKLSLIIESLRASEKILKNPVQIFDGYKFRKPKMKIPSERLINRYIDKGRPETGSEPFYIYFNNRFSRRTFLINTHLQNVKKYIINYFRYIGCYYKYQLLVLDDPIEENGMWKHNVQLTKRFLYLFWIKIWTYKF